MSTELFELPAFEQMVDVILRGVAAKAPKASKCGIRAWLATQRISFLPDIVRQLLDHATAAGLLAQGTYSDARCISTDVWNLTEAGSKRLEASK